MSRLSSGSRRALIACAVILITGLPLLAWAQGSAPKPPQPAAAPAQAAQPATPAQAATPSAAHEMKAPKPAMSDSGRAAARAQIERELKQMADSLKLTPEQRAKCRPIMLDQAYQLRQLRMKYASEPRTAATREAMTKEMQTLRDANDAKLAAVLSADQMTQYKAMREARMAKVRSKMAAPMPAPAAAPMAAPDTTGGKK